MSRTLRGGVDGWRSNGYARAAGGTGSVPHRPRRAARYQPPQARAESRSHGPQELELCWTELGAKQVGIAKSIVVTCRLNGVNVYTNFVDVLQRVREHPASRVADLTPKLWKRYVAANPLRSAAHSLAA